MDSLVLQTAIGLVFVFATFAAAVSAITELISRFIGLRGEYLLRGLRTLLDASDKPGTLELTVRDLFRSRHEGSAEPEPFVTKVMSHPLVAVSADKGVMPPQPGNSKLTRKERQQLPSYVPSRTFATAMIHVLVKDGQGKATIRQMRRAIATVDNKRQRDALTSLLEAAGNDVDAFRVLLEKWYDDHMARVAGWYKRHVRWISLGIGAVLVLCFNLSAVGITRSLYTDQALRGAVVTTATQAANCQGREPADCLRTLQDEIDSVRGAGLPMGWGPVPDCVSQTKCGWMARYGLADPAPEHGGRFDVMFFLLIVVGWGAMVLALVPGARFWFDALARLGTLRSTGPKPTSS
jgi:hypothetical protein